MLIMDAFEDGYSRYIHSVFSLEPEPSGWEVIVYIAPKEIGVPLPNAEYKRLLLEGARHWQLPADYSSMLDQLKVEAV